ncbi:hypothetical protein VU15_18235 [Bacteroides fragilis]|nr:hypothetical protein VU15_18235 [Bacteroides fragilis]
MNVRCVVFWEVVLLGAANVVAIMKVNPVVLVLVLMIVPIMLMGIHQMVLIHVVLLLTPNRNFRNFRIFLLCLKMLFVGRLKDTRVVYENN